MSRIALYILAALVAITLLLFTCTYKVRFNEHAIVTTFGRAGEGSLTTDAGLHFKWPYPVQSVHHFDVRTRVLETRLENVVTSDNQLVAVQVFLTWRISDLPRFFRSLETIEAAEDRLTNRLRSSLGVFSSFDFDDLLSPAASELGSVEQRMLETLQGRSGGNESVGELFGIEPVTVGVSRFILPENTTVAVFERMKQTREALAQDARSSGEASARAIRTEAERLAKTIESFAERIAAEIVARGEAEAAELISRQAESPEAEEFAIFLRKLDAFTASISRNTTIILPAIPPFDLFLGEDSFPAAARTDESEPIREAARADGGGN
ncbi:MAG: protease modulator HflC [Phycisphaerales bacterium]